MNLPLVEGTVVGYSPPINNVNETTLENTSSENENGFEFETHRQKSNEALYRILWDGSFDGGVGYLECVTFKEIHKVDEGEV